MNGPEMAQSHDVAFTRGLLKLGHAEVKKFAPKVNVIKDAWVWHFSRDHWEFHGPGDYYWNGRASNAYEARYKGWMAWLRKQGWEGEEEAA